jgi:hypothetical protein
VSFNVLWQRCSETAFLLIYVACFVVKFVTWFVRMGDDSNCSVIMFHVV